MTNAAAAALRLCAGFVWTAAEARGVSAVCVCLSDLQALCGRLLRQRGCRTSPTLCITSIPCVLGLVSTTHACAALSVGACVHASASHHFIRGLQATALQQQFSPPGRLCPLWLLLLVQQHVVVQAAAALLAHMVVQATAGTGTGTAHVKGVTEPLQG